MLERLFPQIYVDSIFQVPYDELLRKNIRGLIFDLDNTLVPFDVKEPPPKIIKLFEDLKENGFNICLVSNNNENRVKLFNKRLGAHAVHKAGKPGRRGIKKALRLLRLAPENAAVIGDQIFTDVFCANRCGIYSVLVKPVADRDEFSVRLKRGVERVVIKIYLKSN